MTTNGAFRARRQARHGEVRRAGATARSGARPARAAAAATLLLLTGVAAGQEGAAAPALDGAAARPAERRFDLDELQIDGVTLLGQAEIEAAVAPFMGPGRTVADVEQARAALEKAYQDRGYQTVSVQIPPQRVRNGLVRLQVTEGKVGRLRVRGAHHFSLGAIKDQAPSLREGAVPDFKAALDDLVVLNELPDRRVTPSVHPGTAPGTVDVDLLVEDALPLHGSVEVNNRSSRGTTALRTNAALRYDNLWQRGHSLSVSAQLAPQRLRDARVFSVSYTARLPGTGVSLLAYGVDQDSDVSSLGGVDVAGRGRIVGLRAMRTLPGTPAVFHDVSLGPDYKRFRERVTLGHDGYSNPVTYWPLTVAYSGTWQHAPAVTTWNAAVTLSARGLGSDTEQFAAKRAGSSGAFAHLRADASHTQQLFGLGVAVRVQGQLASGPLLGSEQLSLGGLDTVRGYLESEVSGDDGLAGSLEVRSPSLTGWMGLRWLDEWRVHAFVDAGSASVRHPLREQQRNFFLWSAGGGSRLRIAKHVNASVDCGVPLAEQGKARRGSPRVTFRAWAEF